MLSGRNLNRGKTTPQPNMKELKQSHCVSEWAGDNNVLACTKKKKKRTKQRVKGRSLVTRGKKEKEKKD